MSEKSELKETHTDVSVEWRIKEFTSLSKEVGYSKNSAMFLLSDAKWFLRIYPNGYANKDIGWISLYLFRECSSSPQTSVSASIGIKKSDGSMPESLDFNHIYTENIGYGSHQLVKTSELHSKYILDADSPLIVFCTARIRAARLLDVSVVETACQTSSLESVDILQQNLEYLFLNGCHTDVTVKVQDQEFQAHRSILAARSPVLHSMFDHDTEEKKSGIINITDFHPESFKAFLSFLYTGKTDMVSSSNVIGLYKAADKYDCKDLKNECATFMEEQLSAEIFSDVIILASLHNESKLLEVVTDFFIENVQTILPTTEWQSLMREHTTTANELLIKMTSKK